MEQRPQPVEAKSQNSGGVVLGLLAIAGGVAYFATRGNGSSDSPSAGSSQPPTIDTYVGKDPRKPVQGVSFLQHPSVLAGVHNAIPDAKVRNWILAAEVTADPIGVASGWVLAHICDPRNCGDHQWSILIDPRSGETKVCYHPPDTTGANNSWWYFSTGPFQVHPGRCPRIGG